MANDPILELAGELYEMVRQCPIEECGSCARRVVEMADRLRSRLRQVGWRARNVQTGDTTGEFFADFIEADIRAQRVFDIDGCATPVYTISEAPNE